MEPQQEDKLSTVNSHRSSGPSPFEIERRSMPLRGPNGCYLPYRRARKRFEVYAYDPATSDHQISVADLQNFVNQVNSHPQMKRLHRCDWVYIWLILGIIAVTTLFGSGYSSLPNPETSTVVGTVYPLTIIGLLIAMYVRFKRVKARRQREGQTILDSLKASCFRGLDVKLSLSIELSYIYAEFSWKLGRFPVDPEAIGLNMASQANPQVAQSPVARSE